MIGPERALFLLLATRPAPQKARQSLYLRQIKKVHFGLVAIIQQFER
ncbi:MAG: hypothetical protein GYB41_15275 [Oceanospirillales bacterium]|nr:hypothetical protein [Oceanospirillales bacterium]